MNIIHVACSLACFVFLVCLLLHLSTGAIKGVTGFSSQQEKQGSTGGHYNDGEGVDHKGMPVHDMCSRINALFGTKCKNAIYSVIHVRSLMGAPGRRLMSRLAKYTGCDLNAALHMEPEYVKLILRPLGMDGVSIRCHQRWSGSLRSATTFGRRGDRSNCLLRPVRGLLVWR